MDPKKEHLLDTPGFIHMDSVRETVTACIVSTQIQTRQILCTEEGWKRQSTIPNQESIWNWCMLGEGNQFAPRESHWVYQSYSWEEELVSTKQTVFVYLILWDLL